MAHPINPERLAELRERYDNGVDDALEGLIELIATGHFGGWPNQKARDIWVRDLKAYQADHVAMLAEIDRLHATWATSPEDFRQSDRYLRIITRVIHDPSGAPVEAFRLARATAEMISCGWLHVEPGTRPPVVPLTLMGIPVVIDESVPLDRLRVRRDGIDTDERIPIAFTD